jgi:hypothetical protein
LKLGNAGFVLIARKPWYFQFDCHFDLPAVSDCNAEAIELIIDGIPKVSALVVHLDRTLGDAS